MGWPVSLKVKFSQNRVKNLNFLEYDQNIEYGHKSQMQKTAR